jgi:hypothetical protein
MSQEGLKVGTPEAGGASRLGALGDGGPAFPEVFTDHRWSDKHSDYMQDTYSAGGMTLRQWYAGLALQGLLAGHCLGDLPSLARDAVKAADELLAAEGGAA